MKMVRSLALGAAGSVMIAAGAMAADVPPMTVAAPPPAPEAESKLSVEVFSWVNSYYSSNLDIDSENVFAIDYAVTDQLNIWAELNI